MYYRTIIFSILSEELIKMLCKLIPILSNQVRDDEYYSQTDDQSLGK